MADGTLISVDLSPSGAVSVCREIAGERWRVGVRQGDVASLDLHAPELAAESRAELLATWQSLPAPPAI